MYNVLKLSSIKLMLMISAIKYIALLVCLLLFSFQSICQSHTIQKNQLSHIRFDGESFVFTNNLLSNRHVSFRPSSKLVYTKHKDSTTIVFTRINYFTPAFNMPSTLNYNMVFIDKTGILNIAILPSDFRAFYNCQELDYQIFIIIARIVAEAWIYSDR